MSRTAVVRRDPFATISTTARLWTAAMLAVTAPTADAYSRTYSYFLPGGVLYGDCGYSDGPYCTPDIPLPGQVVTGAFAPATHAQLRVLVWASALLLVAVAASRRTLRTRRVARAAGLGLVAALALAISLRSPLTVLVVLVAVALAVPPAWRRVRPDAAAFGAVPIRR